LLPQLLTTSDNRFIASGERVRLCSLALGGREGFAPSVVAFRALLHATQRKNPCLLICKFRGIPRWFPTKQTPQHIHFRAPPV